MFSRKISKWLGERKKRKLLKLRNAHAFTRSYERAVRELHGYIEDRGVDIINILREEYTLNTTDIFALQRDRNFNKLNPDIQKIGRKAKEILSRFSYFQWGGIHVLLKIISEY